MKVPYDLRSYLLTDNFKEKQEIKWLIFEVFCKLLYIVIMIIIVVMEIKCIMLII